MMLLNIAWRNIWRSKIRSLIVIGAVAIGVWAFIAMAALTFGISKGYVDNAIRYQTSHIQIHHANFKEDNDIKYSFQSDISSVIKDHPEIAMITSRSLVNGMVRSAHGARGITIKGVQPEQENAITNLGEKILEGNYLNPSKKNQIIISQELAKKLRVKVRKKVVLQFQDLNGEIVAASFRIAGIYSTGNTPIDLSQVMVAKKDLDRFIGQENQSHEIAVQLNDAKSDLLSFQERLQSKFPTYLIENYRQISPDIQLYESQIYISLTVLLVIFMMALVFGIINTMLMAVLERTRELGMLMAIGMSKVSVFFMIVIETIILGGIGAPLGFFLGWLTVKLTSKTGIDFGAFSEGIERFGMNTIVTPYLESSIYVQLVIAVFLTALLASIYPALKAIRLKPMEAIRKI